MVLVLFMCVICHFQFLYPYRYQFPPLNPLWHGILGFVIGVLGIISVTGNGMVMYIFCVTKSLRTPSNLLVVNLAFSDFLMMACMSPAMVINCYHETWVLGELSVCLCSETGIHCLGVTMDILLQAHLCARFMECVDLCLDVHQSGRWPWLLWTGTTLLSR